MVLLPAPFTVMFTPYTRASAATLNEPPAITYSAFRPGSVPAVELPLLQVEVNTTLPPLPTRSRPMRRRPSPRLALGPGDDHHRGFSHAKPEKSMRASLAQSLSHAQAQSLCRPQVSHRLLVMGRDQ